MELARGDPMELGRGDSVDHGDLGPDDWSELDGDPARMECRVWKCGSDGMEDGVVCGRSIVASASEIVDRARARASAIVRC